MADQIPYKNKNFKASDSPTIIDLETDFGDLSEKSVSFSNSGPGSLAVSVSYDSGSTFVLPFDFLPGLILSGSSLSSVDQIKIEHTGIDSGYNILVEASSRSIDIVSIPNPEIYNQDNQLSEMLLNGGSEDMAVDGSVTPVEFSFTVPADRRIRISRVFITIEDGNQEFDPQDFGAINEGLEWCLSK